MASTGSARPVGLDGRQVGLNLFERGQNGSDLCDLLDCGSAVFSDNMGVTVFSGLLAGHIDINESAETVIFAKVAARIFIARGAIADVRDSFEPDKCSRSPVAP